MLKDPVSLALAGLCAAGAVIISIYQVRMYPEHVSFVQVNHALADPHIPNNTNNNVTMYRYYVT